MHILFDKKSAHRRRSIGILLFLLGMMLNLLLFFIKQTAGNHSGSIAITADAFNNLGDVGSSLLSLLGFWLSEAKGTKRYPFGYGRIEYLSGMCISAAILAVGIRLILSSFDKILHPQPIHPSLFSAMILTVAIIIKLIMYLYNRHFGRVLDSAVMRATAADSLSDCCATVAIMLSMAVSKVFCINIDGICGVMVAMCILYAGMLSMKDAVCPLLGRGADDVLKDDIADIILSQSEKCIIKRIEVHDYGPCKKTADIELIPSQNTDIKAIKSILYERLHIQSVIETQ